jgi:hypothetical protein
MLVVVFSSVALRCLGEEEEGVGSFEQPTRPGWIFPFSNWTVEGQAGQWGKSEGGGLGLVR